VLTGANAVAGEWGHNPLPAPKDGERPGPLCYCGRSGCIETFLSGPGLLRDYLRLRPSGYGAGTEAREEMTAEVIAQKASEGDAVATAAVERYADRLARALGTIVNVLDPDVVVVGGGLSNIALLYEIVPALWAPYIFSDRVDTRLVPAKHGDSSGVRGAAWLWPIGTPSEAAQTGEADTK